MRQGGPLEVNQNDAGIQSAYDHKGQAAMVAHGRCPRNGHFAQGVAFRQVHHCHSFIVQHANALVLESLHHSKGNHRFSRRHHGF